MDVENTRKDVIGNVLALTLLLTSFFVSLWYIHNRKKVEYDPSKIHLRISHWQLELGYREALDEIIKDYEKLHPNVRIHQLPISEQFYGQVINTNLVGGTAPDLMEMGFSKMAAQDQYLARFYEPMSNYVSRPNPYNKGTELEGVAWKDTFIDGMRTWYKESLQEYFGVPNSMFTIRMFYNKDLFKKILGTDEKPKTYGEFIRKLKKIKEYSRKHHLDIVPIAASKYDINTIFQRFQVGFYANYEDALDLNRDGIISGLELYLGLREGKIHWDDPINKAYFELVHEIAQYCQKGFIAVGREQRMFLFVQGKAGMMASGSWDAESIFRQAKFRVGICDFPIPAKNEKYGKYILGKLSEAGTGTGAGYGICRYSKHKDIAIDFLRFLTSKNENQKFNRIVNWIPAVIGAKPRESLKEFMPDPKGFTTRMSWYWPGYTYDVYMGALAQYIQNEITFEEFGKRVLAALNDPNYGWRKAVTLQYENMRNLVKIQEQLIGILTSDRLFPDDITYFNRKYKDALLRQTGSYYGAETYKYIVESRLGYKMEVE